jgi:pimeloyl-ACP methyl ester carboxylesterase
VSRRASEQGWIVDTLLAASGYEVLHPEAKHFMADIGYAPVDWERVLSRVKAGAMFPKAMAEIGSELERKALWYEGERLGRAARDLFLRSTLLYGQAQYSFVTGDRRKQTFREAMNRTMEGYVRNNPTPVERVEVAFEGHTVFAHLHLPAADAAAPLVLLLPGMDMYKEEWAKVAQEYYVPRGFAVLAVDGPGQGETNGGGLLVTLTNYEPAISALLDEVAPRPEIDSERIGLWGVSMGSYWGLRTAAHDSRIRAVATAMGCYGDMSVIFDRAQPSFKRNFMEMSGYTDEARFDIEVAAKMGVASCVDRIGVPVLMAYGEFDELSTVEATIDLYDRITAAKRLLIFEQEFHALGGVGAELIGSAAAWLELALAGEIPADDAQQAYVQRSGDIRDTSAEPAWWTEYASAPVS